LPYKTIKQIRNKPDLRDEPEVAVQQEEAKKETDDLMQRYSNEPDLLKILFTTVAKRPYKPMVSPLADEAALESLI
jgi:hypothetical protein